MEATEREKPLIKDLNEHIVCPLCRGYLIDATTLVECLHSFCRGCIVRRLSSGARACPACNVSTSPPLLPDSRLQRLVYLVVPGLFRSELERRRHFRLVNPQCPPLPPPLGGLDLTLDDFVSLSLREISDAEDADGGQSCAPGIEDNVPAVGESCEDGKQQDDEQGRRTRYLKCPAGVTVRHLVRLLMLKRGWEEANAGANVANRIEMMYEKQDGQPEDEEMRTLNHSWTLLDLACIFGWKRDAPMRLFYRILRKDEGALTPKTSPYNEEPSKDGSSMENIQRPPTPPPSPNPVQEREVEPRRTLESNGKEAPSSRVLESESAEKEMKTKKPRCEVTPVMRTTEPPLSLTAMKSHHVSKNTKDLARLEHRKRRKRRNKRVIAEITTTPREDLLKLKVRLTPCPPRITSNNADETKEKLLQMRAVRREKVKESDTGSEHQQHEQESLKHEQKQQQQQHHHHRHHQQQQQPKQQQHPQQPTQQQQRTNVAIAKVEACKEIIVDAEETIEDIIDSIPDEVVRIAQNITTTNTTTTTTTTTTTANSTTTTITTPTQKQDDLATVEKSSDSLQRTTVTNNTTNGRGLPIKTKEDAKPEVTKIAEAPNESERPRKDEEILRRLGLVAINEANDNLRDKTKHRSQGNADKIDSLDREALEKQFRESKANRTRSLLAEKQMRDVLKSIRSTGKEDGLATSTLQVISVSTVLKKKGPPPLAPLRVTKPSSKFQTSGAIHETHNPKYETPLDLSSGGAVNNVLDLSAPVLSTGSTVASSSSSSSPTSSSFLTSSTSSSSSSSPSSSSVSSSSLSSASSPFSTSSSTFSRPPRAAVAPGNFLRKSKELEQRRGQDTNLRTLSDAAVSILSGCITDKTTVDTIVMGSSNKVALRIPQPQRITGFAIKNKPNLGVRHIPNPQAVVASQYRNQRASFFNAVSQQPP